MGRKGKITRLTALAHLRSVPSTMRTDELLRRVEGLDPTTIDSCQHAGWVTPERMSAGGDDSRWWSESDLNKLRDILRFRRTGIPLDEAYRRASEDRFFGLCPCDWR